MLGTYHNIKPNGWPLPTTHFQTTRLSPRLLGGRSPLFSVLIIRWTEASWKNDFLVLSRNLQLIRQSERFSGFPRRGAAVFLGTLPDVLLPRRRQHDMNTFHPVRMQITLAYLTSFFSQACAASVILTGW